MTLSELFHRHHWLSIATELIRLYPDEEKQLQAYQEVFEQLRGMAPATSAIVIRLTEIHDEESQYIDVDGYYADGKVDERSGNDALALDFTLWHQWLGMKVDDRALVDFTELEIIAHCLYEMTFISFDQEEIQAKMEGLRKTVEEYENMTPEERKRNTKSLEDFLDEINKDEDL